MIGYQLSARAERTPEVAALSFGGRSWTYAELNARACRLARGLCALGVGRGDRVAILLHNCHHVLEALFACAKLGAIFVPLNFRLVAREIALQLEASTPRVLIAGRGFAPTLEALRAHPDLPRHVLEACDDPADARAGTADEYENWLGAQSAEEPAAAVSSEDVLMLLHSSGTTGLPKGIIHTHATVLASSMAKIIDFGLSERDATVVFGPLFHAGPLMDLVLPLLLRGGRVAVGASRNFDPMRLLEAVAAERATAVPIYPTMLRRVVSLGATPHLDLDSLRLIVTGGEATPVPVIRSVHERFPHVAFINNYGSTDGGPVTTFLAPHESIRKIGSVGREAFGMQVRIADEAGQAVGAGAVGEILVRGPFVCRGYWARPRETAESLRDGWWHTGDLGWRDEEGFLYISGRSKDMIKSGTESIYPVEVEQVIAGMADVEEVAVIGVPDDEWGEAIAAFVVAGHGACLDAARIVAHCRENLASYKKPRHVVFVESLPRGTTSKISKATLREKWEVHRNATPAPDRVP